MCERGILVVALLRRIRDYQLDYGNKRLVADRICRLLWCKKYMQRHRPHSGNRANMAVFMTNNTNTTCFLYGSPRNHETDRPSRTTHLSTAQVSSTTPLMATTSEELVRIDYGRNGRSLLSNTKPNCWFAQELRLTLVGGPTNIWQDSLTGYEPIFISSTCDTPAGLISCALVCSQKPPC